jgi:hypothetical protein
MKKKKMTEKVEDVAKDLEEVSGMSVTESSKPKSKSKSSKSAKTMGAEAKTLSLAVPPTLTLVAEEPNTIEWTMPTADELGALTPDDETDDRIVVITAIQWGGVNAVTALWEAAGGIEIKQFMRNPPVTRFTNEYVFASRLAVSPIPKDATSLRVGHITAQKNGDSYYADTIDKPEEIAWSTELAVEFT